MKIKLKQKFPPSTDLITRYQKLLELSYKILDRLSINVEKILYAKITALPRSYLSPHVHVVNPEIITLSLNKEFKITDYDKSVEISKLIWKHSCLRVEFIGSVKGIRAVFILTIRYNSEVEIDAYNNEFDRFDELITTLSLQGVEDASL